MKVAIIGGGAAGFFSAISVKLNFPNAHVTIYEKSPNTLSKVKVSGGGRCNVTNASKSISDLSSGYPRGSKLLKKLFHVFNNQHIIEWFETRGVELKTENEGKVFPVSNNSQSIVDCLMKEIETNQIKLICSASIVSIEESSNKIKLTINTPASETLLFDNVIVASGGSPKASGLDWLSKIGHKI